MIRNIILITHLEIKRNILFLLIGYFIFVYTVYVVLNNIPKHYFESKNIFYNSFKILLYADRP